MMSWRMDMAVLTDLSASMFAATFMILLIFLSLVQQEDARPTPPAQAIEATTALRIARRPVLAPADMVDLLRRHGAPADGLGIDILDDRLEISLPGASSPVVLRPTAISAGLPRALGASGNGAIRLYVFSNTLYNRVLPLLEKADAQVLEISVPRALRDSARPAAGWSDAFLRLDARRLGPDAFREGLAVLLEGGASKSLPGHASGASTPPAASHAWTSLVDRLRRWLQAITTFVLPALGFLAVILIERRKRTCMGM